MPEIMKKVKIAVKIVLFFALLFIVLNIAVKFFAKRAIAGKIGEGLGVKVSLGNLSITPPLSVNLYDIKAGDLFKAKRISARPSILGLLAGKIVLSKVSVISPDITVTQSADGKLSIPQPKGKKGKAPAVYITGFILRDGKITFIDKKVRPDGFKVLIGGLNIDISKVVFPPYSLKTYFDIAAQFNKPENGALGRASFSGWIDLGAKNMDARLSVENLDITYFSPYYGNFISSRKLLSAELNSTTDFEARDNDLKTATKFNLSRLVYAQEEPDLLGVPSLSLSKKALDLFTDSEGNLKLEFEFDTKLDNPTVTITQLENIILKSTVKNIASQDPAEFIKKVTDNLDSFKEFGKELEGIFKGKK